MNQPRRFSSARTSTVRHSAIVELVFAGALWGFGFIAAVWSLEAMGPLTITGSRFAIAALIGFGLALLTPGLRRSLSWEQFRLAAVPGLLLSLLLVLQTWGLRHTTATKSGFITTLYVLIVPFIESLLLRKRLPKIHLIFVMAALVGVALICDIPGALTGHIPAQDAGEAAKLAWNLGDFLTFLCAIVASLHILWFGSNQERIGSAFTFNLNQAVWAGALPLVLSVFFERWPTSLEGRPLIGILMLACGSTLIAFALQVRAQKSISPTLASLLFLLESPFAALFAIGFLGETLRTGQWVGAGLILAAVALSTLFEVELHEVELNQAESDQAGLKEVEQSASEQRD